MSSPIYRNIINGSTYIYNAVVMRVIDGDTIDVLVDLGFRICHQQRLRLLGINAPEMHGEEREKAQAAKDYLSKLTGKNIRIETQKADSFGRYLAYVWFETRCINSEIVDLGLASPWGQKSQQRS